MGLISWVAAAAITSFVGKLVSLVFVLVCSVIATAVMYALQCGLFDYLCNWVSIPALGQVIVWGQAISVGIVVVIRIGVGIYDGILQDKTRAPEYLFKTVAAVVAIGVMPIAVDLVISFIYTSMADVVGWLGSSAEISFDFEKIEDHWTDLADEPLDTIAAVVGICLGPLFGAVACVFTVKIYLQLMVRQFQMLIISVIAPWVGIKAATDTSSGQYWEFLANLLGMGITQIVQGLFLWIALQNFFAWMQAGVWDGFDLLSGDCWYTTLIMLALFMATHSVEGLVDRWTFAGGTSSPRMPRLFGGRSMMMPLKQLAGGEGSGKSGGPKPVGGSSSGPIAKG